MEKVNGNFKKRLCEGENTVNSYLFVKVQKRGKKGPKNGQTESKIRRVRMELTRDQKRGPKRGPEEVKMP